MLFGCSLTLDEPTIGDFQTEGYKPVYVSAEEVEKIQIQGPKTMENPGKIYIRGQYLFVNDRFEGIHIVDNGNPSQPNKIAFIQIPGNIDMAVKGNYLYADNGTDLIVLDISQPQAVKIGKRIDNAFPQQKFPPFRGYFECVDDSRGTVIAWERATLNSPQCFR